MLLVKAPILNALYRTEGCELAPDKIIGQLKDIFTNEEGKPLNFKIDEVKPNKLDIEESYSWLSKKASEVFSLQEFPVFLGGDHSITFPIVNEFRKKFSNPGLIIFDAHADAMQEFKPATHEDLLRALISSGFPAKNMIVVGVRNIHPDEKEFMLKHKINRFTAREIFDNINAACDALTESARKFDAIYVSVDIDVLDPAFAPATGYLEPAGLSSRELIYMLQRLKLSKNLRAADIVEINPTKDINDMTSKLGAKIIAELI